MGNGIKDMEKLWYIWSFEHGGYWKPNMNGYTEKLDYAGKYSFKEALKIVESANAFLDRTELPNEAMLPCYE